MTDISISASTATEQHTVSTSWLCSQRKKWSYSDDLLSGKLVNDLHRVHTRAAEFDRI